MFLLGSALFGFLFVFLASQYVESPKERALKRELQNAQLQFQLLNRKMEEAETVLANVADRDNNIYRVFFEANPIPDEQRKAGFGGINRYKNLEGFDNSKLVIETTKKIEILTIQIRLKYKLKPYCIQILFNKYYLTNNISHLLTLQKLLKLLS